MSLLMDALKKAELAKRKAEANSAPPVSVSIESISLNPDEEQTAPGSIDFEPQLLDAFPNERAAGLEPPAEPESPPTIAPEDLLYLQKIGVTHDRRRHKRQIGRPAAETARTDGAGDNATERETVRNLFETKQPPASRKTFAITVGTITILAVAGIGWYFWNALQPKSGLQAGAGLNINRPPPTPGSPIAAAPEPSATEPAIAGLTASNEPTETGSVREPAEAKPSSVPAAIPAKKLFQPSKSAEPRTDPALERGYSALNRGDTAAARTAYEQALGNDPRNIDALLGLAALAQRMGNPDQAADYYLRLLEADPHNAFAQAALIDLRMQMNPTAAEMRLKQALAAQPDSAPLNFSLGNLYATAKRWPEAQQAYFKAMTTDPGNPDYLFNLAVSLDQLRQPRLAASYYAQAIAAAGSRPAGFDQGKAGGRLRQLQQ